MPTRRWWPGRRAFAWSSPWTDRTARPTVREGHPTTSGGAIVNALSLDKLAIEAHGGLDRWRQFKTVSARLLNGGALWPLKHQEGVLDDVRVRVDLRKQWASHWPCCDE